MSLFTRRRLALQLTPLLDLMLIVIFAQYLEMEQVAVERRTKFEQRLTEAQSEVAATEARLAEQQQELRQARRENAALNEEYHLTARQRDRIAQMAAELFQVPESALKPLLDRDGDLPVDETNRIRQEFRDIAAARPEAMVKHLLTYDELRKRSDVWDLYVRENGSIAFSTGKQTHEFRADTPEQFAARLFALYKDLPQPKSLVIILLSYGDARAGVREAAIQGLMLAAERMREDAAGRTRFEYAVLGYRAEPAPLPLQ